MVYSCKGDSSFEKMSEKADQNEKELFSTTIYKPGNTTELVVKS